MAEAGAEQGRTSGGQQKLQPGLKRRHMTMISLGGIIGAGLFVGTGPILNQAGPATVLTYLLTGVLLILIMRMLGEMAVAQPAVAPWLIALILVLLLTATNLYSVGSYGEFEFWFASIKVAAIIIFIVLSIVFL